MKVWVELEDNKVVGIFGCKQFPDENGHAPITIELDENDPRVIEFREKIDGNAQE